MDDELRSRYLFKERAELLRIVSTYLLGKNESENQKGNLSYLAGTKKRSDSYYDVTDPFWGTKLVEKVAENILSALKNPEEAVFKAPAEGTAK